MATATQIDESIAAEVRAELGRQRLSSRELARRMGVETTWMHRRVTAKIPFSMGELVAVAGLLKVPASKLMAGVKEITHFLRISSGSFFNLPLLMTGKPSGNVPRLTFAYAK